MSALERPPYEVADIIGLYGASYRQTHAVSPLQQGILNAISNCRTAILGGHIDHCNRCEYQQPSYNSCRNRHCPKCQGMDNVRWVQERQDELLPIQYFHVIFTLPHRLNPLAQCNPAEVYNLLIQSATETLQQFADKRWQGTLGITVVLHTWGQKLDQHIHLHVIVTGGVLTHDQQRWISAPKNYLFKVENLSKVYRSKFCDKLKTAFEQNKLMLPPDKTGHDDDPQRTLLEQLYSHPWVVYCKPPFAGPEAVLKYLSRYTHRIAISNRRLLAIEQGEICFLWKDYKDHCKEKTMRLSAQEFIRRFLLHVLPKGYVRIRHFGLLAGRYRTAKLNRCRALFNLSAHPEKQRKSNLDILREISSKDPTRCPKCGQGQMQFMSDLLSRLTHNHSPPVPVALK